MQNFEKPGLDPQSLLSAYCRGVFPMADSADGPVHWYSATRRGILLIDEFRRSRTTRKILRRHPFRMTADTDFEGVMRGCAEPRGEERETWISGEIIGAYSELHRLGFAHSVEAWREDRLVGGIYGVSIHAAFFGESMFVRPEWGGSNASRVALAYLAGHLRRRGYALFDVQFWNPHLDQFGCVEVSRRSYLRQLSDALSRDEVAWGEFDCESIAHDFGDYRSVPPARQFRVDEDDH